jgi:hypothetical protein
LVDEKRICNFAAPKRKELARREEESGGKEVVERENTFKRRLRI